MGLKGRASWSRALWARYVGAGKSATEVRRRLELARKEAPAGALAELEAIADRRLKALEGDAAPAPTPAKSLELADDARSSAGKGDDWWNGF